jgi:hypothetical protein
VDNSDRQQKEDIRPKRSYGSSNPGPSSPSDPTTKRRRSLRRNAQKEEVIDLLDHDSADESEVGMLSSQDDKTSVSTATIFLEGAKNCVENLKSFVLSPFQASKKKRKEFQIEVACIAVGKKVFSSHCELVFSDGKLKLRGKDAKKRTSENIAKINIHDCDTIKELKYFHPGRMQTKDGEGDAPWDEFSFMALQVEATKANNLKKFSNSYRPGGDNLRLSYVVVKFRDDGDLVNLLEEIYNCALPYIDEGAQLNNDQVHKYLASLAPTGKKGKRPKDIDPFVANRDEDDVLLVYPFAGNPGQIEQAAADLHEAKGVTFRHASANDSSEAKDCTDQIESTGAIAETEGSGCEAYADTDELVASGAYSEASETSTSEIANVPKQALSTCEAEALSSSDDTASGLCSVPKKEAVALSTADEIAKKSEPRRHFLTIQVRDFEKLYAGEFLNDTLIDFWMQW